ncbi:hypothetical protein BDA99DRAFT_352249 [Phascolomyces articulosus]|uniref:Zn(2)-C6 fungal-type domain-containing protein n=1 Tax=Phascolomyces articulosus TaxID=60185 RepID=A0AAD5PFV5_9FUNG|nr:hypothetical protein BDA99DRAFT_352249 [Phascolomyces articulosus]
MATAVSSTTGTSVSATTTSTISSGQSDNTQKMHMPSRSQKPVQRKKKAARACIHCQKAHLTCDDSRPCQRCIKRDLASTCTDGARKKAKYLQDVHDSAVNDPDNNNNNHNNMFNPQLGMQMGGNINTIASDTSSINTSIVDTESFGNDPSLVNASQLLDNYNYGFGSSATNLEYSFLSSMLGTPFMDPNTANTTPTSSSNNTNNTNTNHNNNTTPTLSDLPLWAQQQQHSPQQSSTLSHQSQEVPQPTAPRPHPSHHATGSISAHDNNSTAQSQSAENSVTPLVNTFDPPSSMLFSGEHRPSSQQQQQQQSSPQTMAGTSIASPSSSSSKPTPSSGAVGSIPSAAIDSRQASTTSGMSSLLAYGDGAVVAKVANSPVSSSPSTPVVKRRNQIVTPEMAYSSAKKPFSYAEGYHYLITYVRQRMSREDLMRISRALALFRPSVLASMMNLTEDDLIFTEKCLQRTLLEYEKLISYSGTPTVVWRRTGEIALVGKEFSLLTQWSRDTLLGKKTYIYELMSNSSAVEYWEKYAMHAFDNTDSAVYSSCILLSPTKRVVPCTFCFTIKRDIFDLPSVIVGNFLPILS